MRTELNFTSQTLLGLAFNFVIKNKELRVLLRAVSKLAIFVLVEH